MNRNIVLLMVLVSLAVCAGCSYRLGDFTALSKKNIYCDGVDITKLE